MCVASLDAGNCIPLFSEAIALKEKILTGVQTGFRGKLLAALIACCLCPGLGALAQNAIGGVPPAGGQDQAKYSVVVSANRVDDTVEDWSECSGPDCAGGSGNATSTSQTIDNAAPSLDGASMKLTLTAAHPFTNVLWTYKISACDSCTDFRSDFEVYPVSSSGVQALEYDLFDLASSTGIKFMWGMQWNQSKRRWQIWNQRDHAWVDTEVTHGLKFGAWNHIQVADHRVQGDTNSCSGGPCMYFDTLTIDGVEYPLHMVEPSGPLPKGWMSKVGIQFQIDSDSAHASTLTEYVDEASFTAAR